MRGVPRTLSSSAACCSPALSWRLSVCRIGSTDLKTPCTASQVPKSSPLLGFAQPSQGLGTATQGWQFSYAFPQPGVSLPLTQQHPTSNSLWMSPGLPFSFGQQTQPQQQPTPSSAGLGLQQQQPTPTPPPAPQSSAVPPSQLTRSPSKGNSSGSWSPPVSSALAAELRSSPPRDDPQRPQTIKEEPKEVKPPIPQPSIPRSTAESQPQPTPPKPQVPLLRPIL